MGYNFTSRDIKNIVDELNSAIRGGRIQNIFQTSNYDIYIEVYSNKKIGYLLISIENGFNRIYYLHTREQSPQNPYAFQMLMRKYLPGEIIQSIVHLNGDRVVRISTSDFNIYAELTGRHSNIFLTDECDIILGSIRENVSQKRPLFISNVYIPPVPHNISLDVTGIPIPNNMSASEYYSEFYRRIIDRYRLEVAKGRALRGLKKKRLHYCSILKKIRGDREKALRYNEYLKYAEALKQHIFLEKRKDLVVCEYYTESGREIIEVPIDCRLTLYENMERYFKEYKRYENALEVIDERERKISQSLSETDREIERVSLCRRLDDLPDCVGEKRKPIKGSDKIEIEDKEKFPFAVFYVEGIGKIYSGSDAVSNEILTFRFARGNDLWFHITGYSGSHTILPLQKNKVPSERQILTAALIAAARSSAPEDETVEVAYTRVKYVRKAKDGVRGSVIFSKERHIRVKVDRCYISRIMRIA